MTTQPRTFLFMPESAYGPTNNCIGIGNELIERGHRVVFAAEASWAGKLAALGFEEDLVDLAHRTPTPASNRMPASSGRTSSATTAPEFRKTDHRAARDFVQAHWQALDRRREVLPAAAAGDHRARSSPTC